MTLAEGDLLPAVALTAADGSPIALGPAHGRPLVLFFYPKADTPGCTAEAKDFSALADRFAQAGVDVIGVSRDAPAKLARFAHKHDLRVTLASDAGELGDAFGFWGEKRLYGRIYMGLERATLLVNGSGRIARVWRKVKVAGHAEDVLAAIPKNA